MWLPQKDGVILLENAGGDLRRFYLHSWVWGNSQLGLAYDSGIRVAAPSKVRNGGQQD